MLSKRKGSCKTTRPSENVGAAQEAPWISTIQSLVADCPPNWTLSAASEMHECSQGMGAGKGGSRAIIVAVSKVEQWSSSDSAYLEALAGTSGETESAREQGYP
jgi:hypothetical protein